VGPSIGACWTDHAVPFQDSAIGTFEPALLTYVPTATHALVDVHDTPTSSEFALPDGRAAARSVDHELPFHSSTSVARALGDM
jgi:hypothetical protein